MSEAQLFAGITGVCGGDGHIGVLGSRQTPVSLQGKKPRPPEGRALLLDH